MTGIPSHDVSTKKYKFHSSPTGARVVPANNTGKQCINGWEFHYQNWRAEKFDEQTYIRSGASLGNLKPPSRKGCLDIEVLWWHGLTTSQVCSDPIFFYQMLFPFCNPSTSGIDGDHCMPYFSNVYVFTNKYAMWKGAGVGYGHDFTAILIPELVHWTGVPLHNGVLDGKHSTLFH